MVRRNEGIQEGLSRYLSKDGSQTVFYDEFLTLFEVNERAKSASVGVRVTHVTKIRVNT